MKGRGGGLLHQKCNSIDSFFLKFSTNEVRGPFITPVQQTSQSEQIVETAEDEVESPKWSYSGPTGKSIGVSGQESLIYLVVSK